MEPIPQHPKKAATNLERMAWTLIQGEGLPEPEVEFRFHRGRKWRFDFAWPDHRLALEIEGGTWTGGAHVRGKHFEADCEKYAEAAMLNWRVIRCTTDQINIEQMIRWLRAALTWPQEA